jgi:acetolactate synthase-1/3 small subunit
MERTIAVVAENRPGVFSRISGLMERRGFQVNGVTVGMTQQPGRSRFTLVIGGDDRKASQAVRQIRKMVETVEVSDLSSGVCVERCMMLLKFSLPGERRAELSDAMKAFPHSVAEEHGDTLILEMMGTRQSMDACLETVRHLGLVEAVKSGPLALDARTTTTF